MKKAVFLISSIFCIVISGFAQKTGTRVNKSKPLSKTPVHKTVTRSIPRFQTEHKVEIATNYGIMVVKLYNETPQHRDNFLKLVQKGFYDSLLFHRVINTFMIQGGDPNSKNADSTMMLGSGDLGYTIPAEFNPTIFHKRGALAAARDNNPQKASSACQFYIVQGKRYAVKELEDGINTRNMSRKQEVLNNLYQRDSVQAKINQLNMLGDKEAIRKYVLTLQPAADKEYELKYPDATKVDMDQIEHYVKVGGAPMLDGEYTVFGELIYGWEVLDKIAKTKTRKSDDRPLENIQMKMRIIE